MACSSFRGGAPRLPHLLPALSLWLSSSRSVRYPSSPKALGLHSCPFGVYLVVWVSPPACVPILILPCNVMFLKAVCFPALWRVALLGWLNHSRCRPVSPTSYLLRPWCLLTSMMFQWQKVCYELVSVLLHVDFPFCPPHKIHQVLWFCIYAISFMYSRMYPNAAGTCPK